MDITVPNKKLRKALEDEGECKKQYGTDMSKKIFARYTSLSAAESLATFWPPKSGPERCHELTGDLAGLFSVDVKQPYRLLFKPTKHVSKTEYPDEQERWKQITAIEIQRIEDTHG